MVEVARIHNEQGNIHWLAHRAEEAGRWHREALALLGALPPASADQPSSRYELARTHYLLGRNGPPSPIPGPRRWEEERNRWSQVKPTRQARPPRSEPAPPDVTETGQPENRHLVQATADLEQLVEGFPNVPVYRQLLAYPRAGTVLRPRSLAVREQDLAAVVVNARVADRPLWIVQQHGELLRPQVELAQLSPVGGYHRLLISSTDRSASTCPPSGPTRLLATTAL